MNLVDFMQRLCVVLLFTIALLTVPNLIEAKVAPEQPDAFPWDAPRCPLVNAAGARLDRSIAHRSDGRDWILFCEYR